MSATKIKQIEICDFRGFPAEAVPPIELGGKNLLLFGENGSGKSTIFHALSQLLDLNERQPFNNDQTDIRCLKNRFTDPSLTNGRVVVSFTQTVGTTPVSPMTWRIGGPRPSNHPFFRSMGRTKGFLDYRALLQTHFAHREQNGINLFTLVVQDLLRDVEFPNNGPTFGPEWDQIKKEGEAWLNLAARDVGKMDDAEKISYGLEPPVPEDGNDVDKLPFDESTAFQSYVAAQQELLEKRIKRFNDALWQRIVEIQRIANTFIGGLGQELAIDFSYSDPVRLPETFASSQWPSDPELNLRARFRSTLLEHPGVFLNEARLTAIALAFYLAALKVQVPDATAASDPSPRILVLDDVLIGLDLSHRMPILAVLETEFVRKGWQVLLFTYDRVWFELAQLYLKSPGQWTAVEMHCGEWNEGTQVLDAPILRPQTDQLADHLLKRAEEFLKSPHFDPRVAGLHARAALEVKLKGYCSKQKIPVPYDLDGSHLNTDHFLMAIERRLVRTGNMPRALFGIQRVKLFRKGVLNPLAHFHPVTLAPTEVEAAIRAVKELRLPKEEGSDAKPTNCAAETVAALAVATTPEQVLGAASWLRTTFEVDLRKLLVKHGGRVIYRDDWSDLTLDDLWVSAKDAMTRVNSSAAAALVTAVEAHPFVFLNEWRYSDAVALTKIELDAAWAALQSPQPSTPKTRLEVFA